MRRAPEKIRAGKAVRNALARGDFRRPDSCSECGKPCVPDAHHNDYSKPLEIVWLCRKCHVERHDGNFDPTKARSVPIEQRRAGTAAARAWRKYFAGVTRGRVHQIIGKREKGNS